MLRNSFFLARFISVTLDTTNSVLSSHAEIAGSPAEPYDGYVNGLRTQEAGIRMKRPCARVRLYTMVLLCFVPL